MATNADIPLTLEEALTMGLRFNLAAVSQSAAEMQAEGNAALYAVGYYRL